MDFVDRSLSYFYIQIYLEFIPEPPKYINVMQAAACYLTGDNALSKTMVSKTYTQVEGILPKGPICLA